MCLTENCGLLKNVLPGDLESTLGKSQLEQKSVDETHEIAAVRIHVERVIGHLRNKFTILQGILQIKMIMKTDDGTSRRNQRPVVERCPL